MSCRLYKTEFNTECYLDCINLPKYRIPVSKIRANSHDLEIERGRYTRPRLNPNQRLFLLPRGWGRGTFCWELSREYQWTPILVHKCILMIEKNAYFLQRQTNTYVEIFCTSHLLLELWKLTSCVLRHNTQVPSNDQLKTFIFIDWRCLYFALPRRWYDIEISKSVWAPLTCT